MSLSLFSGFVYYWRTEPGGGAAIVPKQTTLSLSQFLVTEMNNYHLLYYNACFLLYRFLWNMKSYYIRDISAPIFSTL